VQPGFKKFYLKNGYFKLYDGANENDVVLDRPLDGFVPIPGTITAADSVLTAIEKLDFAINSINPAVNWGSITGNILAQSDLISYLSSNYYPLPTGTTSQYIRGDGSLATFPTIPTVGTWGALNYPTWVSGTPFVKMTAAGTFALDTNTYLTSAVTAVTATSPITSSGGATPNISTSMNTNKLIGRSTAGVGVMEEITIGSGLTLSGGILNATGGGGSSATSNLFAYYNFI
jgi:hypothetical protein